MRPAEQRVQPQRLVVVLDRHRRAAGHQEQLRKAVVPVRFVRADANVGAEFALGFRKQPVLDVGVPVVVVKMAGARSRNRARPSLHERERFLVIRGIARVRVGMNDEVVRFLFVGIAFDQALEQFHGQRRIRVVLVQRFGEQPLALGQPIELSL